MNYVNIDKTVEAKSVYIKENSTATFSGNTTNIVVNSEAPKKVYGILAEGYSKLDFKANNIAIDVSGIGASGSWEYGIDLNGRSEAAFTGGSVLVKDYQQDYTAQTLTIRSDSKADFSNQGNVVSLLIVHMVRQLLSLRPIAIHQRLQET